MSTYDRIPSGAAAPHDRLVGLAAPAPLVVLAFGLAFLASAEIGHWLSFHDEQFGLEFATFWPPSGLFVAALLIVTYIPSLTLFTLPNHGAPAAAHAPTAAPGPSITAKRTRKTLSALARGPKARRTHT